MDINSKLLITIRKVILIVCLVGMGAGFFSIIYFQNLYPESYIYDTNFEVTVPVNGDFDTLTIDATVYEPKHGLLSDPNSDERPLAVLIHGFAMEKDYMLSISIELAKRGVSSISISMPGHGFSDPPYYFTNASPYAAIGALDYMLYDNENLHYPIDETKLAVIGHSMGAMSAIKAGVLDDRFISTVSMAAPSGESNVLDEYENFNLFFLDKSIADWVNQTNPNNLYFVVGKLDELAYELDAQAIMSAATGVSVVETEVIYGEDFTAGTSRKYSRYPYMDHVTEVYDTRSVGDVMDWIGLSFGMSPDTFNGDTSLFASPLRPILIMMAVVCSFLLFLPLSSYLNEKLYKTSTRPADEFAKEFINGQESGKKFNWKLIAITIGSYFACVAVIPLILGNIINMKFTIFNSILTDSAVPMFFVCGFSGILIYVLSKIFKWNPALNKNLWRLPIPKNNEDQDSKTIVNIGKYIVYSAVSAGIPIFFGLYFWSTGLYSVYIAPYEMLSFGYCIFMLIPICFANQVLLSEPLYNLISIFSKNRLRRWIVRLVLPLLVALIAASSMTVALTFTIGAPIMSMFPWNALTWFGLLFSIFSLTGYVFASWSYYMDGSIYLPTLIPAIVVAIVIHIMPVVIIW